MMRNNSSNTRLAIQDIETKKWVVPYVIEPSSGVDRGILAIMNEAYNVEDLGEGKSRTVLKLKPHLSPIKAAVIPLKKNNEELVKTAKDLKNKLQKLNLGRVVLENTGNIGKGYRRHDEVGTPLCITIDFETLEDNTATVRDRDTMKQERISIDELPSYLIKAINQ
ncbi:MAG: glycine--tRNA ligase [SAR86 cluster bacterium SAR86B]|uniref:Glycine--tRNA ligase n=1 Tax=SAR86 cluster bacterium SAR86B TaxID=1123867 RepID=J4V2N2_9GAMM|nr:MAG: glycine--tRNA ligase [SAR86 cluster bacterium SAR86B]